MKRLKNDVLEQFYTVLYTIMTIKRDLKLKKDIDFKKIWTISKCLAYLKVYRDKKIII